VSGACFSGEEKESSGRSPEFEVGVCGCDGRGVCGAVCDPETSRASLRDLESSELFSEVFERLLELGSSDFAR
jgi:hypothetical protein